MKRSGLIGAVLVVLATFIGYLGMPAQGQYNVFLNSLADLDAWTESYEVVRYNPQLNVLTLEAKLSPLMTSLQLDVIKVVKDIPVEIQDAPNDPDWGQLWGMQRITAGGAAYDITVGAEMVVAAVIDTGINTIHPDLRAECRLSTISDTCVDGHGHGTHVAGTIAATINNAEGVAGVVSSDVIKVWGYKALSDGGSGTSSSVALAITAATDEIAAAGYRGVINMSLGGNTSGDPDPTMDAAVNYATERGVVVVSAAGNSGAAWCFAPASSPNSMCVGAIGEEGFRASFSNYGRGLDLVAPGVNIRSTLPGGEYANWQGTSMATPHVAGAAVALLSIHPDWSAGQIRQSLVDNTDAPPLDPDPFNYYGAGVANAYRALTGVEPPPPTPGPPPTATTAPTGYPAPPTRTPTLLPPTLTLVPPTLTPVPPTETPVPTAEPTVEPEDYDYSDSEAPWPVIRMSRVATSPTLGESVTIETEPYANERDDGAIYFDEEERIWKEIEGQTMGVGRHRLYFQLAFEGQRVWLRACLSRPDGSQTEEFFVPQWGAKWYTYNFNFNQPGLYVLRVVIGDDEATTCNRSGKSGEVSDYFFAVGPPTPEPTPVPPTPTPQPTPTPELCRITVPHFVDSGSRDRWWAYTLVSVLNWFGEDEYEAFVFSVERGWWGFHIQSTDREWCAIWETVFDKGGYEWN